MSFQFSPEAERRIVAHREARNRANREVLESLYKAVELPPAPPFARKSFAAMVADAKSALAEPKPGTITARGYQWKEPSDIPPRDWVYGWHYIRGFVSATVASGGTGKSSLAIVEALDMVTGRGLLTGKPTGRLYRVWIHNGEDPLEEIERRVAASCKFYNISPYEIGDRLFITSGRDSPVLLATTTRDGAFIARPVAESLILEMLENRIDVLIIDPFVSCHAVSENDNSAMSEVVDTFRAIADEANASVELIHHMRKVSGQASGQERTADDGRGAGAVVDATRSTRAINVMPAAEADALGISQEQRRTYFWVGNGKQNLVAPSDTAKWFHLASVDLENGTERMSADHVGVVEAWEKPAVGEGVTDAHVAELRRRLSDGAANRRDSRSASWAGAVLATILGWNAGDKATRKRLQAVLESFIVAGVLKVTQESNGKGRSQDCVAPGPSTTLPPQLPQSSVG